MKRGIVTISHCKSHLKVSSVLYITQGVGERETEKEREKSKEGQREREREKGRLGGRESSSRG